MTIIRGEADIQREIAAGRMNEGDADIVREFSRELAERSELPFVKPSKTMDDETFLKHFNARHMPLAGLVRTLDRMGPGVVDSLRAYHKRVHRSGVEGGPEEDKDGEPTDHPHRPVNHKHRSPAKKE